MLRILIADGHAIIRKGLRQILVEVYPDAYIEEAADAQTVIKRTLAEEWDIIICDISMTSRGGTDVMQHVKQNSPKTPVLILGTHQDEQYAIRVLKAGAAGYFSKDSATDELVKAVQKVLQGRKYISAFLAEKMANDLDQDFKRPSHQLLSDREFHVFKLIAQGKAVSEIAEQLSLSNTTVSTYRARILSKMDMRTHSDLIRYALENNLI